MKRYISILTLICLLALPILCYAQRLIDVDLSSMNSMMAYSQLSNILRNAPRFIDKTIKVAGEYQSRVDRRTGMDYHFIVLGLDICCVLPLQFEWLGEHTYPDDYPPNGTDIVITGKLKSYIVGRQVYYYLETNEIVPFK